jgi:hypothetical protein
MSDSGYPGNAWSRLRDWLKLELDTLQTQIMSGTLPPADYAALCREVARIIATLNQMRLIQSGQDLLEKREPSPLRNVE